MSNPKSRQMKSLEAILTKSPNTGFHELRRLRYFQRAFAKEQCRELSKCFNTLCKNTIKKAPLRQNDFRFTQERGNEDPRIEERRLEQAIWKKYCVGIEPDPSFFLGFCEKLVGYQIPIQAPGNRENNLSWGEVDLVGISTSNEPVLIELKKEKADDSVHSVLVEIVGYGLAQRAEDCGFLKEWKKATRQPEHHVPELWHLVCLAPRRSWLRKLGYEGRNGQMPPGFWSAFKTLVQRVEELKFKVHFASLCVTKTNNNFDIQSACAFDLLEVSTSAAGSEMRKTELPF